MNQNNFFVSELLELKPIRSIAGKIPSPLARYLMTFCNASTPGDARKAIEDFFKVSVQLTLLMLISIALHLKAELPKQLRSTIRDKWLLGNHDLTEGERLYLIKEILREMKPILDTSPIGQAIVRVYSDQSYDDLDSLIIFKTRESHLQSGSEAWSRKIIADNLPSFQSLISRWNALSQIELLLVKDSVGWVLIGPDRPERRGPGDASAGLLLHDTVSSELVPLNPLISAKDDFSIEVFCGANGRKPTASRFASLGHEATISDGPVNVLELVGTLLPREEPPPLFGMERTFQLITTIFKDWTNGRAKSSLLFVTGEEGTGKTSLILRTFDSVLVKPIQIPISGATGQGELKVFCLEILAGLFGIDSDFDARIIQQLRSFGESCGALRGAETLSSFLAEHTDVQARATAHLRFTDTTESQKLQWSDNRRLDEQTKHGYDALVTRVYLALFSILRAWTLLHERKIVIWLQDAQLFERQPDIAINTFLTLHEKQQSTEVLVIAEFRAERTRDSRRIRERYMTSTSQSIETQELDMAAVRELIAWRLGIQAQLLPIQVSEEIYKTSGGNPKWILDVFRSLEDRGAIKKGSSPTELALVLPKLFSTAVPGELKDITKSRVLDLSWTSVELDVLSVLSLSSSRTIPVAYVAKVLGDESQQTIRLFEEIELLSDDDSHESWHVTFEHLAARQACMEICEGRRKSDLDLLTEKALAVLANESESLKSDDTNRLLNLIARLAELTENPEALALTVAGSVPSASKKDLQTWSSITKRTVSPSAFLAAVRDYIALKLDELEEREPKGEHYQRLIQSRKQLDGLNDKRRSALVAGLFGSSLGTLNRLFPGRRRETVSALTGFLEQIAKRDNSAISAEELLGLFCKRFWEQANEKAAYEDLKDLWYLIESQLTGLILPSILRLLFVALSAVFSPKLMERDDFFPKDKLTDLFELIGLATDELQLIDVAMVTTERLHFVKFVIRAYLRLWAWSCDPDQLKAQKEKLFSLLDNLEGKMPQDAMGVRCMLAARIAASYIDSGEREAEPFQQFLEELCRWKPVRLFVDASILVNRYQRGIQLDGLANMMIATMGSQPEVTLLELTEFQLVLNGINVIDTEEALGIGRHLFWNWIEDHLREEEGIEDVLKLIEESSPLLRLDAKDQLERLSKLKKWKKDDAALINIYKSEVERSSDDASVRSDWQKRFDSARDEYFATSSSPSSSNQYRLVEASFRCMADELLSIKKADPGDADRLHQFLKILDHWVPQEDRGLNQVWNYWGMRWHTLMLLQKKEVSIRECREMLEISGTDGRRLFIPELAEMLGPTSSANDEVESLPIATGFSQMNTNANFVLSDEFTAIIDEWMNFPKPSYTCGQLVLNAASFAQGHVADEWLERAETVADRLSKVGNNVGACALYEELVVAYYLRHNAEKSEEMTRRALLYVGRRSPRASASEVLSIRNNGNYVQLGLALRENLVIESLFAKLQAVHEENILQPNPSALYPYNYAIALAYSGQLSEAFLLIKEIFSQDLYAYDLRKNQTRCVFVFTPSRPIGVQPEVENVHIETAYMISACQILTTLNRLSEASMWTAALIKRLKTEQEKIRDKRVWDHVLSIFLQLKAEPDHWLAGKIRKEAPGLVFSMDSASGLEELVAPKKNNPCPCGSQRMYRDCCSKMLRQ
jgi:hypothetical protein